MNPIREEILGKIREALGRKLGTPPAPIPPTARIAPRKPGDPEAEIALLLGEIEKLSGVTRRLASREELGVALAELVKTEDVKRATVWTTPDLADLGVGEALKALGVELVPAQADKHLVATKREPCSCALRPNAPGLSRSCPVYIWRSSRLPCCGPTSTKRLRRRRTRDIVSW
jgi:L-lactate utilization protein LutC